MNPDEAALSARFADRLLRADAERRVLRADLDKATAQIQALTGLGAAFQALNPDVAELAARMPAPDAPSKSYTPVPAPRWHLLTADEREEAVARIRAWVNGIYRPR